MLASQNLPFTLTLTAEQRSGRFTLTWDTGSYSLEFRPEMDVTLGDLLRRLQPVLVGGPDSSEKLAPAELLHAVGTRLWRALLPETASTDKHEALAHELRASTSLLLLTLPPNLAVLPWELLCDPQAPKDTGFLARRRPMARLIPGNTALSPLAPPLRVLLLISSPPGLEDQQEIDVESERVAVENATRGAREAGLLHLLVEDIITPHRVQQALVRFKPHLLHYIGHGSYDKENGGYLLWEDEQGDPLPMFGSQLADLLRPYGLRAVLLHGCKTANSNKHSDFRSIAGTLMLAGIPAILAQQAGFTYGSSQRASEMLYTSLTSGLGIAEATFEVRQALTQAERPDWAVPTLQSTVSGLLPLMNQEASPGIPDPALERGGAAADLPAPTGVFVGRQRELRALRSMLESLPGSGHVFALITGPGGVGKSTLAAQAVTRYGGRYKATLTLRCEDYQHLDLFLQHIGEFLQRQGAPALLTDILPNPKLDTITKIDAAIKALDQAGPFLLLVDNLESIQSEDRTLSDASLLLLLQRLLTNLHAGRVLVTGRYVVEGLLPHGKFAASLLQLDLNDLSNYETQQLLARHYTLAGLGDVVRGEIVREFGGLPYVYDLLSSKAASQDLEALIHDAQGRITRVREQRSAYEWENIRHRVVEFAALESTVARLPEQSRILLGKLSLFRNPFPLRLLEQGLGAAEVDWKPLLDWALLRHDPVDGDYSLHSLTAYYGQDLLNATDRVTTQIQIAEWYFDSGHKEFHDLSDYLEAYRLLRAAGETRRAGKFAMGLGEGLHQLGLYQIWRDLCMATINDVQKTDESLLAQALHQLGIVTQEQGEYEEARRLYGESLTIEERLGDQEGRAVTLHQLGVIAQRQGEYEEARYLYGEVLTIAEQLGDQGRRAGALHQLGKIAQEQGEYEEARGLYGEALTTFERLGNRNGQASTLHQLGMIAQEQGEYEEARYLYEEALTTFERLGNQSGQASTLHQLGVIAQRQGEYEEARYLYEEVLTIAEQLGDQSGRAGALYQLGVIAQEQREYEEARRLYGEAMSFFERLGDQSGRAHTLGQLGTMAYLQGEYEEARRLYGEAMSFFERLGDQNGRANILHQLGMVAQGQGKYEEARRLYKESLSIKDRLGDQSGRATTLHQLGMVAQEQGEYEEARRLYGESLAIKDRLGNQSGRAMTLHQLGKIAQKQGKYEEARHLYRESLAIRERLGDQKGLSTTLGQLGIIALMQGEYEEAQHLYGEAMSLFERLGDQSGQATTLHHLGTIAYLRGEYEEAQHLYGEAMSLFERLGDQSGQANTLAQLGLLAHKQRNYPAAVQYMAQAFVIFQHLHSPSCHLALQELAELHDELGDATFATLWQEAMNGQLPPDLPAPDLRQDLLFRRLVAFIQAETWNELQRLLEAHPELLDAETDALLRELAAVQQNDAARQLIEQHRSLPVRNQEGQIEAPLADLQAKWKQSAEDEFTTQLNILCQQVVGLLLTGDASQREALAHQLKEMAEKTLPVEGANDFLTLLAAWLRKEDIKPPIVEALQPVFQQAYQQMAAFLTQFELPGSPAKQDATFPVEVMNVLDQFIREDWPTRRLLLEKHSEMLLSDQVEPIFDALIEVNSDLDVLRFLEDLRTFLHCCRVWGTEPVWYFKRRMHMGNGIALLSEYESAVMQIATLLVHQEPGDIALEQAVTAMQRLLDDLPAAGADLFEAALYRDLADTMRRLPAYHPARKLEQMEAAYRASLPYYQDANRLLDVLLIKRSLGSVLNEQGHYDEALGLHEAAIAGLRAYEQYQEEVAWIEVDYACALDNLGRTEEALAAYADAITLLPETAPLYRNRAEALIHARRLEEAEADLAQAVALDGHENSPYLWCHRAQIAIASGEGLVADQLLDEVVQRGASFDVALQRAQAAWLQGKLEAAQEALQHTWELANPGERAAIRREMERLFAEHPELAGKDTLHSMIREGHE